MGLLHIYCGDGKGKTTTSLGLAVRMTGAGMKTAFVQFMKGGETAELETLKRIPDITVMRCDRDYGFFSTLSDADKKDLSDCHDRLLESAFCGGFDAIILDEFNCAYNFGLMDKSRAEELILAAPRSFELILTGRDPAQKFIDAADYVSEIKCIKHPYQNGIAARKGIEY